LAAAAEQITIQGAWSDNLKQSSLEKPVKEICAKANKQLHFLKNLKRSFTTTNDLV
jgi:hypothetical protein